MKIQFLGTGAADWPNPGAQVGAGRRNASLIVNDSLMIDCNAMTPDAIREFNVDVNRLQAVIIGHPHQDHFDMETIAQLALERDRTLPPLQLHVDKAAAQRTQPLLTPEQLARLDIHPFTPGDTFSAAGYAVQTLPANHPLELPGELASHFLITLDDGKNVFYALDGAWLLPPTWKHLQKTRLDVIVWELTCGNLADWRLWGHSNLGMLKLMVDSLRFSQAILPGTTMFCSHLARTLCPPQDIYQREVETSGFILAYDGLIWQDNAE